VIAALVRKGIVPFHAWVPEVFDHGRLGPAILFSAPQVGAYITVVLIVPRASPDMLRSSRCWRSGPPCTARRWRSSRPARAGRAATCS
jgi:NADH:ubiquinone oxidoreductase subunit 2 (subunit N)